MKLQHAGLLIAIVALITCGWCVCEIRHLRTELDAVRSHHAPPATSVGELTATNAEARLRQLESAAPSPGVFMSAIHLHFSKLYFAAEARNWDLAYFERGEIVENLDVVAALRPNENGVNLPGLIEAFKKTQLTALKDAIDVKDRGLFRAAYRDSLTMCNACHQATGRPFIVITVPTNPPVANQQWELSPAPKP